MTLRIDGIMLDTILLGKLKVGLNLKTLKNTPCFKHFFLAKITPTRTDQKE